MENLSAESLGRELPTEADVKAVQLGVKRYGVSGLCNRTGVVWSVTCGTGFGCAVKAESLAELRRQMQGLSLYVPAEVA